MRDGYHGPKVRITAPRGMQRAKEGLVHANLMTYSDLSELRTTLSPLGSALKWPTRSS